jgi:hypothetical protein
MLEGAADNIHLDSRKTLINLRRLLTETKISLNRDSLGEMWRRFYSEEDWTPDGQAFTGCIAAGDTFLGAY